MIPAEFTNFTRSSGGAFQCPSSNLTCFTTGNVSSGTVNIPFLPVYRSSTNGVTIEPWFLVMENPNSHDGSNVTWVTDLVMTYVDIVAGTPIDPTHGTPLTGCSLVTPNRAENITELRQSRASVSASPGVVATPARAAFTRARASRNCRSATRSSASRESLGCAQALPVATL